MDAATRTTMAASTFSVEFDEADVRLLCGKGRFMRADELERAGHVVEAWIEDNVLAGVVQGTWRRLDEVRVGANRNELVPACGCGAGGFCRHVGALLLHWVRDPGAFDGSGAMPSGGAAEPRFVDPFELIDPLDELQQLLTEQTMNELRAIVRRRRLEIKASLKTDMVERLAAALADPEVTDAALAELRREDLVLLAAAQLIGSAGLSTSKRIREAIPLLGGGDAPVDPERLDQLGLIFAAQVWGARDYESAYIVPRAVAARLPALGGILSTLPSDQIASDRSKQSTQTGTGEAMTGLALALAEAAMSGNLQVQPRPATPSRTPGYYSPAPTDWQIVPIDQKNAKRGRAPYGDYVGILQPSPPLIQEADLQRLREQTGREPAAIDQCFRLLRSLGVLNVTGNRCSVVRERLLMLLAIPEPERRLILTTLWRSQPVSLDVSLLVGEWGELEEIGGPSSALNYTWFGIQQRLAQRRHLLVRLLGRLAPNEWHPFGSLIRLVERLEQIASLDAAARQRGGYLATQSELWVAERGSRSAPGNRTPLGSQEGWKLIGTNYVAALLNGPLRWLGMVDIARLTSGELAFRLRPEAGLLVDRVYATQEATGPIGLSFGDDLSVIAPSGQNDASIYQRLSSAGELVELTPEGVHFRLTQAGMRRVFESGAGAPEVLAYFEANAAEPLPKVFRETLQRWWRDFGTVRLYDQISLIELADDLLLPELLARTSLDKHIIHQFSPRVVVVETAAVEELQSELTRLGYSPRLIEGEGA